MHLSVRRTLRAFALALALTLGVSGLAVMSPVGAMPIEGFPSYQPQKTCSPKAKSGTLMLQKHLLSRYQGSGSLGISRTCSASGTSEHKEGRAFDWALNVKSKRDRGYARNFLHRLMATDKAGHRKALARRMGIMYLIWNDHIWSASKNYRKSQYLHPACKRVRGCSKTLRHRNHMHISLTWRGARAKTSWYVHHRSGAKKSAKPKKTHPSKPKATSKPTKKRQQKAKAKAAKKRKLKAAEARKHRAAKKRAAKRRAAKKKAAAARRKAQRKLPDGILDLRRRPYRKIRVPADGTTVETKFKLREGVTYSLTAAGLYTFGNPNQVADAACSWSGSEDAWVTAPSRRTKRRHGRLALAVNGSMPFTDACRRSHTYRTEITPTRDRTLRLRVALRHPASAGRITVVVGRKRAKRATIAEALPTYPDLTPAPEPTQSNPKGFGLVAETVDVPASGRGTYTVGSLSPDATYRLTVGGVVRLGKGVLSDGQCVEVRGSWYRKASIDPRVPQQDHGNLYVNGVPFSGRATGGSRCGGSHSTKFTPDSKGRLRLDLWDPLDRSDNRGELQVKVQRLTAIPTPTAPHPLRPRKWTAWQQPRDWFEMNSRDKDGTLSTIKLRKGVPAQIFVRGKFTSGGRPADASCVKTSSGWVQADPDVVGQDPLNVWVDDQAVTWRALGPAAGCSSDYRYTARFTPAKSGRVRVSVFDLDHRDNKGELTVTVLREAR